MSEKKQTRAEKELAKSPSISTLLAPTTPGDHVFRVQLKTSSGKYLTVDQTNLLSAKSEVAGPETIFELHKFTIVPTAPVAVAAVAAPAPIATGIEASSPATPTAAATAAASSGATTAASSSSSTTTPPLPVTRYAIRSALGKFLNVDDSIELFLKDKQGKDLGPKADKLAENLTEREKGFEIVEGDDGSIAIKTPDEYLLANDTGDVKIKLSKNSTVPSSSTSSDSSPFVPLSSELFTPLWLDDRSPLTLSGSYLLRTAHGLLWCVEPEGTLVANRLEPLLWEMISVRSASLKEVRLVSVHGGALEVVRGDARKRVAFTAAEDSEETKFEVVEVNKKAKEYAFRARNGLFLSALGTHIVTASSKTVGPWEVFQLTPVSQS